MEFMPIIMRWRDGSNIIKLLCSSTVTLRIMRLTRLFVTEENMARFAMALLLGRIRGGHSEVVRMELEGRLMLRESCFSLNEMNQPEYCI